ncbi:hypothetical protein AVEN_171443-1 [Araneus ventricosus]|uniref:Secreted protein n=1 Tax=Araneus ventricosus TaxID=182803 RepID=A0A4Y2D2P4_ARAVE|nr:hypothetical protein AVEN_171443-1 [Araneus ventricosus]
MHALLSLVVLTRFEVTRWLFWDEPCNFQPLSDVETTPHLAPPLQTSAPKKAGEHLAIIYGLACNRPHTRKILNGIVFRTMNRPSPKPRPYR